MARLAPRRVHRRLPAGLRAAHLHHAARMVELLGDERRREAFGKDAREHVRGGLLLPRLLRDELELVRGVLGARR